MRVAGTTLWCCLARADTTDTRWFHSFGEPSILVDTEIREASTEALAKVRSMRRFVRNVCRAMWRSQLRASWTAHLLCTCALAVFACA